MLLDELMPNYEFNETHQLWLHAPADRVLDATKQVTPHEMPLVRLLFGIRSLPAVIVGRRGLPAAKDQPLYGQMLASGFVSLGEESGRELAAGVIGQMWKLRGNATAIRDARDFIAFDAPGYAKAIMSFSVQPEGHGARLTTETRVLTTDAVAHRGFARYWRIISPGSAAIRRSWLRAVRRRVELGAAGPPAAR